MCVINTDNELNNQEIKLQFKVYPIRTFKFTTIRLSGYKFICNE